MAMAEKNKRKHFIVILSSKHMQVNYIPGTIIANIVCSLLTDIQGGRLLFITKTGQTEEVERSSPNGLTPPATNESLTL